MRKFSAWLMVIAGLLCLTVCCVMTVMAVRFLEWGRVLFYAVLAVLSLEMLILGILKIKT